MAEGNTKVGCARLNAKKKNTEWNGLMLWDSDCDKWENGTGYVTHFLLSHQKCHWQAIQANKQTTAMTTHCSMWVHILHAVKIIGVTFCLPGNLNLALRRASWADARWLSFVRIDMMGWPMSTLATVPWGLPNAPLIPVCKLRIRCVVKKWGQRLITHRSAPAHDNILLIRITWNGCRRILKWNWSLPQCFTMYLLAQIRPASSASLDSCSNSFERRWRHRGKLSTGVFLAPKSKILILASTGHAIEKNANE